MAGNAQSGNCRRLSEGREGFFFELGRACFSAPGPNSKKFLRRFFQKAASF
jgi:hypothetical protein